MLFMRAQARGVKAWQSKEHKAGGAKEKSRKYS